jgi:hypothetical protein
MALRCLLRCTIHDLQSFCALPVGSFPGRPNPAWLEKQHLGDRSTTQIVARDLVLCQSKFIFGDCFDLVGDEGSARE